MKRTHRRSPTAMTAMIGVLGMLGIIILVGYWFWRPALPPMQAAAFVAGPDLPPPAFPLSTEPGKRYLVDAKGTPFLIQGDAAWSLIAELTREEVLLYLDDRKARGFNTVLVNLLEHAYARRAPANINGDRPFMKLADFSTPNEAYFEHVDWVLQQARDKGFLVLLAPAYLGYKGGADGWYSDMVATDLATLRAYGRFLGKRYRHLGNIMWVAGGDYNPPDRSRSRAIVEGIRDVDPLALQTAHGDPDTAVSLYWADEPWLKVNNVYTYGPVCPAALDEYARADDVPFFLIESTYEHEHGATEQSLREQAYSALLCGGAGQVFGNNPIWHFEGPGIFDAPVDWKKALGGRGSQSMTHLANLFVDLPWWELVPEIDGALSSSGAESDEDRAVAACLGDKSVCIAYLPGPSNITVDMRMLGRSRITAKWFDPSSSHYSEAISATADVGERYDFRPAAQNAAGFGDWVLVIRASAAGGG